MLIKYGDLDVTHRLLEYKVSIAFAKEYLIGNVPTMQLNLKFDNYDGILDDLDITKYWEVQENDNSDVRYFKVYDQPEKYTKSLSLKLYDDNYELDVPYATQLSYPVTIKDQLDEIETLTGFSIVRTNIPMYVLEKEVSWYDNTIVIRNYLGWIAELFGANVFASGKGSLGFVQVTKDVFAKTDTLTNYEKNELYSVSRVYYENGINPLEKGDTTGNTVFLDSNNLYLTDEQDIIDKLYDQLNGLIFNQAKSISMISIDNLLPGYLVNYNDEFDFMVTDISITYKGGEFSITDVDGSVATKNEERVIKKTTNSTRIRKLQITQDQEKSRLDIVAKEQEGLNKKVGELSLSNEEFKTKIENIESKLDDVDLSLYRVEILSSGTIINENNRTITLDCKVYNGNDDVTDEQQDLQFNWLRNDVAYKTGKGITVGSIDVDVSANFKCLVTVGELTLDTGCITIIDETDIANLGNSYLDCNAPQQYLDGTFFPDFTTDPLVITPCIMDDNIVIDLKDCDISYKKIVNGLETDLTDETVKNGVLTLNKNIMDRKNSYLNYACTVTYKNSTIKLFKEIGLILQGQDAILLNISSSNGTSFKNNDIATALTVTIFVGDRKIDSSQAMYDEFGNDAKIIWSQKQIGEDGWTELEQNDKRISDNGFIFTITSNDINTKCTFTCTLDF